MPPLSNWHEIPGFFSSQFRAWPVAPQEQHRKISTRLHHPRGFIVVSPSAHRHYPLELCVKIRLPPSLPRLQTLTLYSRKCIKANVPSVETAHRWAQWSLVLAKNKLTYFQKFCSNGTIILMNHRVKRNGSLSTTPEIVC